MDDEDSEAQRFLQIKACCREWSVTFGSVTTTHARGVNPRRWTDETQYTGSRNSGDLDWGEHPSMKISC